MISTLDDLTYKNIEKMANKIFNLPNDIKQNFFIHIYIRIISDTKSILFNRYMAEWIESWDLEAMTSFTREIGVSGPVGTSRLEFFHPGFIPTVFLH